ncbi:peroxisome assembly factor 2-like [Plakobranchus ocellatus]|uniref:Peroxisomal ATPase PEX6 n=1 Tax=Plakobranchus ocellatus TaxID=259542 RepID=A0AAV4BXR8_9GAST|nr:peroxisome assembly factor 2-like [Plakobranchus ocellatus]
MTSAKDLTGNFRRSYQARLCVTTDFDPRINPLHLTISKTDAAFLQRSTDDDTFMCALRVKREGESDIQTNASSFTPVSHFPQEKSHSTVASSLVLAEDIIVCVWALDRTVPMTPSPRSDYLNHRPLSIDGDSSSDDDFTEDKFPLDLKCSDKFLNHYNIFENGTFYIRAVQTFPLNKAIFSVSDIETYEWLQEEDFTNGLLDELCNHEILVRQNDVLLAPFPQSFINNSSFCRTWYFNFKAIACAPFQIGVMTEETEIIIFFEKAITSLPADHRHLSGPHLEQYMDMQSSVLMSNFCRSLSSGSGEMVSSVDATDGFPHFFLSSASVIQQMIHWKKILFHDENFDSLDLTSVLGMPMKLMMQYGILNGSLMKICLYPRELCAEVNEDDARRYLKEEKPKQKYVKVQRLSRTLDETEMVFISSILLFNLQKGPPVIRSPLLILEKPVLPRGIGETEIDVKHKLSRSVSTTVPYAADVSITIISSPSYTPKANHVESLNKYFQIPRLLSMGDVFAVNSQDDPEFWQESAVDTGVRKPTIFFKVSSMLPQQPDVQAYYVDVNNSTLKQIGSDHSYVPLSASKYLSNCDAVYGQSIVCLGLEKYIVKLEDIALPHLSRRFDGASLVELLPCILLSGPSGCGKRTVVNTVARRLYVQIMEVNCHDLTADTAGASESRIETLFLTASKYTPCILLMRNIEVMGKERDSTTEDPRTIGAFNRCVSKLASNPQLFPLIVIATTREPSKIPEDMLHSFLHEVAIESPNESERGDMIQGLLESYEVSPDVSVSHLAQRTAGFVLGDLVMLTVQSKRCAYQKALAICRPDGSTASLQEEEDLVAAGIVMEQKDMDAALNDMQAAHSDSIGAPKIPSVKWSDIGGLADVKSEILDTVQLPLQNPQLLAAGLRRSGVLLYGPPGTGKTLLAKAVATECSLNFLSVKGPELINMYVGQSEENVRQVFKTARSASPCVIFFDELDSLAPNRGRSGDSGGVMDRIVSQLLAELDGLHQSHDIFVIGATNRPDLLDPALLRPGRFDKLLYLGVCGDSKAHLSILQAQTKKFKLTKDLDLMRVAEKCPSNLTGADLYALCADAMLNCMRRKINKLEAGADSEEENLEVSEEDFDSALKVLVPSVSKEELQKYEKIKASFQA